MAAPQAQLRVSRYFAVLAVIIAVLYALVFFTGSGSLHKKLMPRLGLDLQGGTTVTLEATTANGKLPKRSDLDVAKGILRDRIDSKGVAEPEVAIEGDRNIVINVPGKDSEDVKRIGDPAEMRFRQVLEQAADSGAAVPAPKPTPSGTAKPTPTPTGKTTATPSATAGTKATSPKATPTKAAGGGGSVPAAVPTASPTPSPSPSATASAAPSDETSDQPTQADVLKKIGPLIPQIIKQAQSPDQLLDPQLKKLFEPVTKLTPAEVAVLPTDLQLKIPYITCDTLIHRPVGSIRDEKQQVVACEKGSHTKYLLDKASVVGKDVSSADYNYDTTKGWKVDISFKGSGQDRWTKLTEKALNKQVAVVLDNTVISAPQIQSVIAGNAEVTGSFSQQEAQDFASKLKFGALPLTFKTANSQGISATLGLEQLKSGLLAGGIGLALVIVYSLIYYRALGFVTIFSLVASAAIIYASVVLLGRQIGFTLTLAGVAGFIVAVGITADSFVVFFERLKDEVKEGRTVRTAVPRAWVRARRTILSADTVSFLAAATLYIFAIGQVRGFAFTLGLSTVVDLLIVFLFTHPLVALLARSKTFTSPRISGLGSLRAEAAPTVTARTAGASPKES